MRQQVCYACDNLIVYFKSIWNSSDNKCVIMMFGLSEV